MAKGNKAKAAAKAEADAKFARSNPAKAAEEGETVYYRGETPSERDAVREAQERGDADADVGVKPEPEVVEAAEEAAEEEKEAKVDLKHVVDAGHRAAAEAADKARLLADERRRRQDRRNAGEEVFVEDAEE